MKTGRFRPLSLQLYLISQGRRLTVSAWCELAELKAALVSRKKREPAACTLLFAGAGIPDRTTLGELFARFSGLTLVSESFRLVCPHEDLRLYPLGVLPRTDSTQGMPLYAAIAGWGVVTSIAAVEDARRRNADSPFGLPLAPAPASPLCDDWIRATRHSLPGVYAALIETGAFTDNDFLLNKKRLPAAIRDAAETLRAEWLLESVDPGDLDLVLAAAPRWLLAMPLERFLLPPATRASLVSVGVRSPGDLLCCDWQSDEPIRQFGPQVQEEFSRELVAHIRRHRQDAADGHNAWLPALGEEHPHLHAAAVKANLTSDATFMTAGNELPRKTLAALHRFRWHYLMRHLEADNPAAVLHLLPAEVLQWPIAAMRMNPRALGAIQRDRLSRIGDLLWLDYRSVDTVSHLGRATLREIVAGTRRAFERFLHQLSGEAPDPTLWDLLARAVGSLKDRPKTIVQQRLGIDEAPCTLQEIGDSLRTTAEGVRRAFQTAVGYIERQWNVGEELTRHLQQYAAGHAVGPAMTLQGAIGSDHWFSGFEQRLGLLCRLITVFCKDTFAADGLEGASIALRALERGN